MTHRGRTRIPGSVRLATGVLAAVVVGLLLGVGLGQVSGGSKPAVSERPSGATTTSAAAPVTTGTAGTPTATSTPAQQRQLEVIVFSAVLDPAATASGRQRLRARVTVHVMVSNRGASRVTAGRPALLVAGARVTTDPHADAPGTRLGPLAAGAAANLRLHFEVAGPVTTALTNQRSARMVIAGRGIPLTITVGSPVTAP